MTVSERAPVVADLMLLPKNGRPHFGGASWELVSSQRPNVARMIRACCASTEAAGAMYSAAFEGRGIPRRPAF